MRNKSVKAFTLIELLLSTMLGGILVSAVAFTFANMAGSFAEQPTTGQTLEWDTTRSIPYSPAYSQLPAAFSLQAEISDALQATLKSGVITDKSGFQPISAIFVISSDETATPNLPVVPSGSNDDVTSLTTLSGVASGKLTSSAQCYTLLNSTGTNVNFVSGKTGYSIYFISDDNTVNMAVHCREEASGTDTIYTVKTYVSGKFSSELSYAYGLKNTNSSVNPSARHIKLRSNASWGIDEDIGTQVIFPDPTVLPYEIEPTDADAVRTYSRFAVLLPIKP